MTCTGYGNKNCCSATNKCSSGLLACAIGCQKAYGKCLF
jgi:hypothetical protein